MKTQRLAEMTYSQLQTREQHLLTRAGAPGIPGAGHSHSRQVREVRAEMSSRQAEGIRAGYEAAEQAPSDDVMGSAF